MKILLVHNFYKTHGGEESVLQNELEMLETYGHQVITYTTENGNIGSFLSKVAAFFSAAFSVPQFFKVLNFLKNSRPDVVHVHNYFPVISPAVFYACKLLRIPSVHTLHNYRAVCPTALLYFDGKVCETSVSSSSWWAVSSKVYRRSYLGTLAITIMVEVHKFLGTWRKNVNCFVCLTQFSRGVYVQAGWPENKIVVKPNFVADPLNGKFEPIPKENYGVFVGRLSEEKGVSVLLEGWPMVDAFSLKVMGEGPLVDGFLESTDSNIEYIGRKAKEDVIDIVQKASFLVIPSVWYEGFPMVIVEAFACGTPVIASRLGSMEEIIDDGVTGLLFDVGDPNDLARKINFLVRNPKLVTSMSSNARNVYLSNYTKEKNYHKLIDINQNVILQGKPSHGK